jgi:hypothetical protein
MSVREADRYRGCSLYRTAEWEFLNEELLSEGYAYADRRFRHSYFQKYLQLESVARSAGKGWKNVTPEQMPPWRQKQLNKPSSLLPGRSLQVVFPDLAVERSLADPQDLGRLLAVALRPGQRVGDRLLFQLVQGNAGQTRR